MTKTGSKNVWVYQTIFLPYCKKRRKKLSWKNRHSEMDLSKANTPFSLHWLVPKVTHWDRGDIRKDGRVGVGLEDQLGPDWKRFLRFLIKLNARSGEKMCKKTSKALTQDWQPRIIQFLPRSYPTWTWLIGEELIYQDNQQRRWVDRDCFTGKNV